jgi:hypothetical protein
MVRLPPECTRSPAGRGCGIGADPLVAATFCHTGGKQRTAPAICVGQIAVPYGEDDGIIRMLVLEDVFVVIYLGHQSKSLHIFQIDYLG